MSRSASSSAKTHPAARKRAITAVRGVKAAGSVVAVSFVVGVPQCYAWLTAVRRIAADTISIFPSSHAPRSKASPLRSASARPSRTKSAGPATYLAVLVLVVVYCLIWLHRPLPVWVAGIYIAASVACYVLYAIDKRAAVAGRNRISERTLHLVAVLGGWPGAIVAQQTLRHKTAKASFRRTFWATVVLNLAVLILVGWPIVAIPR